MSIRDRLVRRKNPPAERLSLQELREQLGVRRVDVANRLGRSPQAVLQFEHGLDPKVGTLSDYVRALADELDSISGDLTMTATFDDQTYDLDLRPRPPSDEPEPIEPEQQGEKPGTMTTAPPVAASAERSEPPHPPSAPAGAARPGSKNAWKIGSATWFDPGQVDEMLTGGFIAMSEDEIDVGDRPDDRTLAQRLKAAPREAERQSSERGIQTFVRYWRTFLTAVRPGDVVVLPRHNANVAVGVVQGEPFYDAEEPDPKLRHRRAVDWYCPDVSKKSLPEDLARSAGARGTIGMIRATDAASRLRDLGDR